MPRPCLRRSRLRDYAQTHWVRDANFSESWHLFALPVSARAFIQVQILPALFVGQGAGDPRFGQLNQLLHGQDKFANHSIVR